MISAHMFQQGPAINVNKDTTSKSINANPMGTISYAIDINLKLVTNNTKPIWARSKLLCFNKDQLSMSTGTKSYVLFYSQPIFVDLSYFKL